jgi:hypothetical protein
VAHYIFNFPGEKQQATDLLRAGTWIVPEDEPHRDTLAAGDLALIYLAAPERTFIGRVELASEARDRSVLVTDVEQWDPPVPMAAVLAEMDPSQTAKADFEPGVVRITATEYETALAVAAGRTASTA